MVIMVLVQPKMNAISDIGTHNVELRRCVSCPGTMAQRGFKRNFLRHLAVFRCSHCRRLLEQETRGFQGFYIGVMVTIATPMLLGVLKAADVGLLEGLIVFLCLLAAFWPVYLNTEQYLRSRIIKRGTEARGASSHHNVVAKTLGGDSRLHGAALGVVYTLCCAAGASIAFLILVAILGF